MKSYQAIYLVSSPFQAICCINLIEKLKHRNVVICVSSSQARQILESRLNKLTGITYIFKPAWLKLIFFFLMLRVFFLKKTDLYVGDVRSLYHNIVALSWWVQDVYAYDDGAASIALAGRPKNEVAVNAPNVGVGTRILYRCMRTSLDTLSVDIKVFFTIFDIPSAKGRVEKLSLSVFDSISWNESTDIFLGGKYVDIGVMSEHQYISAIRNSMSRGHQLLYVAHRAEREEMLASIGTKLPDLKIIKPRGCVELYLIEEKLRPKTVYSIYSTALITLSEIAEEEAVGFQIDLKQVEDVFLRDNIAKVYSYLRDQGVVCLKLY